MKVTGDLEREEAGKADLASFRGKGGKIRILPPEPTKQAPLECRKEWEELAGRRPSFGERGRSLGGAGHCGCARRGGRAGALRGRGERSQRGGGSGWRQLRAGAECPECTCGGAAAAARRRQISRRLPEPQGLGFGFRGLLGASAKRPVCRVEWPELRARRAPGDEDDGVGGGCNDGLSRRGR